MASVAKSCHNWDELQMNSIIATYRAGVTLVGGAPVSGQQLQDSLAIAPHLVAADGGADRALKLGHEPDLVIGDLDSISRQARQRMGSRVHHITEQASTDFDKALRSISAPFVLAVGFTGARLDHGLAALNTLLRHPDRRCLLLSGSDVVLAAPPRISLRLPNRTRLSLFPMAPVTGRSRGLRWPIDGLDMTPWGQIGTSNITTGDLVELEFDQPGMLIILPRNRLDAVLDGLGLPGHVPGR